MRARDGTTLPTPALLSRTRTRLRAILAAAAATLLLDLGAQAALFEDVTPSSGIAQDEGHCFGSAWGDYNNDGYPDLCIAASRGFGGVDMPNCFYRNDGNSPFVRLGSEAGPLATDARQSFGVACVDFNNDGQRDFLLINSAWNASGNDLYWNHGDGTFGRGEAGELTGRVAFRSWQACADYDGDGWVDVCLSAEGTTRGPQSPQLYHATGHGTFTRTELGSALAGLNACVWADYDNDGHVDFLGVHGMDVPRKAALYHNNGDGTFTRATDVFTDPPNRWSGAAWADYDNDGFMDLLLLRLVGCNRLYHNLGLGDATMADRVIIEWPSGNRQEYVDLTADRIYAFTELKRTPPPRPIASPGGTVTRTNLTAGSSQ